MAGDNENVLPAVVYSRPRTLMFAVKLYSFVLVAFGIIYTAIRNPGIFVLSDDTLSVVTQFYNTMVLLLIPFFLGALGGCARMLLSGVSISGNYRMVIASGMMGAFSWLSIKSRVFVSIIAPYISHEQQVGVVGERAVAAGNEFDSLALVAVVVGMFASNIYIAINERVERASRVS